MKLRFGLQVHFKLLYTTPSCIYPGRGLNTQKLVILLIFSPMLSERKMSIIALEAETKNDIGKGASRRLRRLENKIPAVIYGGGVESQSITLSHNKVKLALEVESIYSSVFDIKVG